MTTKYDSIEKQFTTPLGLVRCGFECEGSISNLGSRGYQNGVSENFRTSSHLIEIITFQIPSPLSNGMIVRNSSGWVFRIERIGDDEESLTLYCLLDSFGENICLSATTGESLDALEAVIDKERVRFGSRLIEAVAIYHIINNKISKVYFID